MATSFCCNLLFYILISSTLNLDDFKGSFSHLTVSFTLSSTAFTGFTIAFERTLTFFIKLALVSIASNLLNAAIEPTASEIYCPYCAIPETAN